MGTKDRRRLKLFKRESTRLRRLVEEGTFDTLPCTKREGLVLRVRRLYNGLSGILPESVLRSILSTASVIVLGMAACGHDGGTAPDGADVAADFFADDVDGNDVDIPDVEGCRETMSFAAPVPEFFGFSLKYYGNPAFADIDGDGDLDFFTGGYYQDEVAFFLNTGTPSAPSFSTPAVVNPFGISRVAGYAAPVPEDIDSDGDTDLIVVEFEETEYAYEVRIKYYENTGSPTDPSYAPPVEDPFGIVLGGYSSLPVFADLDADGDLDIFMGEMDPYTYRGNIVFSENRGTPDAPSFAAAVTNPFGIAPTQYLAAPAFMDTDCDGDLDLLVGEERGILLFENTGTAQAPSFAAPIINPFGISTRPPVSDISLADIDGDGDVDVFVEDYYGTARYLENTS